MKYSKINQHSITSTDGTTISYSTIGKGPGVIIIPGALEVAREFYELATCLAESYTVHIIERRGRGQSGPQGDHYDISKECEDVLALHKATNAPYIIGHSYGGLIALEAARNNNTFLKLALYEPGVSINGSIPTNWMPLYREQLAQGKYLDAFTDFSLAIGPESAKKLPRWIMKLILRFMLGKAHLKQILSLLPESLREHEEVAKLDNSYKNYAQVTANVLLMYGGKSVKQGVGLHWVDSTMRELKNTLPNSTTKVFARLDHFGLIKAGAPEVAKAIGEFLG